MDFAHLLIVGLGLWCCYLVWLRRENLAYNLRFIARMGAAFFVGWVGAHLAQVSDGNAIVVGFVACALVAIRTPARSRYISARERRKTIARFELSGEKYNSRKHHLDHTVPFSRGGSSTADNLRVRPKRENLSKGNKSPWWDVLGR